MKIKFEIDYHTRFGQKLCVVGNLPVLGNWDEDKGLDLTYGGNSLWTGTIETQVQEEVEYYYVLKEEGRVTRKEWGKSRVIKPGQETFVIRTDSWHEAPRQHFLYTSAFTDSLFRHEPCEIQELTSKHGIKLQLHCACARKEETVVLCGESELLGSWDVSRAIAMNFVADDIWEVYLDSEVITAPVQYKFVIVNSEDCHAVHWEEGENRILYPEIASFDEAYAHIYELFYRRENVHWKAAGIVIPVFSLRSHSSFGIGEFSDLRKMIDWAKETGMKVIQVLPVNDTTITHSWTDSYPYNAISIYALHPIYLGIEDYPLKDIKLWAKYKKKAEKLNALPVLDYDQVMKLKESYFTDLYREQGEKVIRSAEFKHFFKENKSWLFPYACFTYFRDIYKTADYTVWKNFGAYHEKDLVKEAERNQKMKAFVDKTCFIQFLLHKQLASVKEYAHANGIILKGDIPIGISRSSVEAWVSPKLFNLDTQTGAPPDDFSVFGQNWGFPTYNWENIAKDGYQWWIRRFRKMADYFDAYRIDHILGFFRIWEIPADSVQGLLGYFNPALPFTEDEIRQWGMEFDELRMLQPFIHEDMLEGLFGDYTAEIKNYFLNQIMADRYELREFCNTQQKVQAFFESKTDDKSVRMREGLYKLLNEVLFIKDKRQPDKYHPRITAQHTASFRYLNMSDQEAFNRLYEHFFYHRHNEFWGREALKKLPVLINSTNMLVCGEDLGMIPECVPEVMRKLQILSLEIQRMPKQAFHLFDDLSKIPYLSVCTTSTHDMSPVRSWWKENRDITQRYYNEVLWQPGEAPEECTPEICRRILINHLDSNAMLTIIPFQDWMSMNGELRRNNPEEERINIPAVSNHYWQYRMHLPLEVLLESKELNCEIKELILTSGR